MRRRQPNRLAGLLAATLAIVVGVAKGLRRIEGKISVTAQYILLAIAIVLAIAYLASLFLVKDCRRKAPRLLHFE